MIGKGGNMKLVSQRCPQCGGNTKKIGKKERYCDFCKTSFFVDKNNKKIVNKNITINNYYSNSALKINNEKSKVNLFPAVLTVILIIGGLFFYLSVGNSSQTARNFPGREQPQSSGMKEIIHQIFEKEIDEITTDDLKKVTFLNIDKTEINNGDYWKISYSQLPYKGSQPSDIKTIQFSKGKDIDATDITVFKNLQYLNFNQNYDIQTNSSTYDFSSLKKIKFYGGWFNQSCSDALDLLKSNGTLEEISAQIRSGSDIDMLIKLKHLRSLDATYVSSQKYALNDKIDLNKLRSIKDLNKLSIYLPESEDLSWLASLNHLNSLSLTLDTRGELISDFSSLYGLSQLENLEITNAEGLKDISFIKNMPKLKHLGLNNTGVSDLSPLSNRLGITSLTLLANDKINNFSPIQTLSSLSKIKLEFGQDDKIHPSQFKSLNNLKNVEIREEHLPAFIGNKAIENLEITDGITLQTSLQSLSNLKSLVINDATSVNNLGILKEIGIEKLMFHHSNVSIQNQADFGAIFLHPTLQKLGMIDGYFFVHQNNVTSMSNTHIKSLILQGNSNLYENKSLFFHQIPYYTNIEDLTLTNCDIDDLSFLNGLTQLRYLNLSDNRITDVNPLVKLQNLKVINLTNNPIQNIDLVKGRVIIK